MSAALPVLVVAAGAAWERPVLELLNGRSGLVLQKRCVDLADLLATSSTGLAGAAVVESTLPGLDADSISMLGRGGVGVVVVVAPDQAADAGWLGRIGVRHVISSDRLDGLVELVSASAAGGPGDTADGSVTERPAEPGTGRLVAVWGPTGAPGRTTVAVGLAVELARRQRSVLLLDGDPYGGAVAQHLGVLDEVSGLLAAARMANSGRLDLERLSSLCREVEPGLRVLTGLPRPDRWVEVRPSAFEEVLDVGRRLARHVVVDVGFSLEQENGDPFGVSAPQRNGMTLTSLSRADEVLVVGAADPVGLSRLARGLVEIRDLLPSGRLRVVVNRTRSTLGWTDKEITGMVEGFVMPAGVHFLPEDRQGADRALMAGQSLAESGDGPLRRAIADVAESVLGAGQRASDHRHPRRRLALRPRRAGRGR